MVRLCECGTLRRLDGVPLDVGAPVVFMDICFPLAVFVALDCFVEMNNADPATARFIIVVLGDAGGPRVRFDIISMRAEGFSCLIDSKFAQSIG